MFIGIVKHEHLNVAFNIRRLEPLKVVGSNPVHINLFMKTLIRKSANRNRWWGLQMAPNLGKEHQIIKILVIYSREINNATFLLW